MKHTPVTYERCRTFTLEQSEGDFKSENVAYKNGLPELPMAYVRNALLTDAVFCIDVTTYGFPMAVTPIQSDTAETFDVVVKWSEAY